MNRRWVLACVRFNPPLQSERGGQEIDHRAGLGGERVLTRFPSVNLNYLGFISYVK